MPIYNVGIFLISTINWSINLTKPIRLFEAFMAVLKTDEEIDEKKK